MKTIIIILLMLGTIQVNSQTDSIAGIYQGNNIAIGYGSLYEIQTGSESIQLGYPDTGKYVVSWCIYEWVGTPCPQPKPIIDEFGLGGGRTIIGMTAAYCTKKITDCGYYKGFNNLDSAKAFYKRAIDKERIINARFGGIGQGLENIILDTIP